MTPHEPFTPLPGFGRDDLGGDRLVWRQGRRGTFDRDAIVRSVDLVALADELLGARAASARTAGWRCPEVTHAQSGRTPPVTVFSSHRGEQRWRCHGCGAGGTAIDLVMACRTVGVREALEELAGRAGLHAAASPDRPTSPGPAMLEVAGPGAGPDTPAFDSYVESCADALWRPEARRIRRWLTEVRGLPESALRANKVGADRGPRRQSRPDGMARAAGVVLPVMVGGHAVYAQIRVLHPQPDRPRYLNPSGELATNPRLGRLRPANCHHDEVIVTEGAIDGLSATAAGYRAVAVLSAGYADASMAHELSRIPHPIVIAMDPDAAGRAGSARIAQLLAAMQRPAVVLDLGQGDLNDTMRASRDWPSELGDRVAIAVAQNQPAPVRGHVIGR